jgi:hypothetical protein
MTPAQSLEDVPQLLGKYRSAANENELTVILNCSYLFASRQLKVAGLIGFISRLLNEHIGTIRFAWSSRTPTATA